MFDIDDIQLAPSSAHFHSPKSRTSTGRRMCCWKLSNSLSDNTKAFFFLLTRVEDKKQDKFSDLLELCCSLEKDLVCKNMICLLVFRRKKKSEGRRKLAELPVCPCNWNYYLIQSVMYYDVNIGNSITWKLEFVMQLTILLLPWWASHPLVSCGGFVN